MEDPIKAAHELSNGEKSLELYENLKNGLLEDPTLIEAVYEIIIKNQTLKKELEKDKDIKKTIKAHEKIIDGKFKELQKESVFHKFKGQEDYDKWVEKQKKPYSAKVRGIMFAIEVLATLIPENMAGSGRGLRI